MVIENLRFMGRKRGWIDWDKKIYYSKRNSDHLFRIFNGLGISVRILNHLRDKGVESVIILYERAILVATVQLFYEKGIIHRNELDTSDSQLILPLNYFEKNVKKLA